jgi:SAM-dependent methyltransferase
MLTSRMINRLLSLPGSWDLVQAILGIMTFKRELYLSKLHPPGRLLDFGCANGHIADIFREFEYYGVDLDPAAIDSAKRRHRDRPNMQFLAVDLRTRPFPEVFFDEILFAGTVHHLDDQAFLSLLIELHYCLKPTGILHIIDPVFRDPVRWSHRLVRWLDQGKYPRTLPQILAVIEPLGLFKWGEPTFHTPYGSPLQDCDFVHIPLTMEPRDNLVSKETRTDQLATF